MWKRFARIILHYRIIILLIIALFTTFMAYRAKDVELDYNYVALLPEDDPYYIEFEKFKKEFGEDAYLGIIGIQDSSFFELKKFTDWRNLQDSIKTINGVIEVLSVVNAIDVTKNTSTKKFEAVNIFPKKIQNQQQLDTLAEIFKSRPFYDGLIYNDSSSVLLMVITMDKKIIDSKAREKTIDFIEKYAFAFGEKHDLEIHLSGLPYTRTKVARLIKNELFMFIFLAMFVTAVILYMFFRSFKVVTFSMLIVAIGVIWAVGSMDLFDYRITVLTGMIPPLIIVIGIPNSVYLLNKYHNEYKRHGNKIKALHTIIRKVGNATFLTNLTTALGFATFVITGNNFLIEFGVIASLNIMGIFILSITLIPIFFSYLNPPKDRHIKHLDYKLINKFIDGLVSLVTHQRKLIYGGVVVIVILGIYGITLIKTEGYIIDDIPHDNPVYTDLKFLENNIGGVMPLEITIDTKKKKKVFQYQTLKKMETFIERLAEIEDLSKPTSIVDALKFARQAYYNGSKEAYKLPSQNELVFISDYLPKQEENSNFNILNSFVDENSQITRISYRLNDIGTIQNKIVADTIAKIAAEVFPDDKYKVSVTGSSIIFTQGTNFLVKNLLTSLALAIGLIAVFMASMFTSLRMIVISLIPNFIPLLFTAAIMGYFHIPIKPSTVLVFSIAFGISVDNAIHFLAKYRLELIATGGNIQTATMNSLRETGVSIIYTAGILFFRIWNFHCISIWWYTGTRAFSFDYTFNRHVIEPHISTNIATDLKTYCFE
jgi:predicted RND superfamily exporter protein